MHSGINISNSVLAAAFGSALMYQGLTALLVLAAAAVTWVSVREWRRGLAVRRDPDRASPARAAAAERLAEPPGRRLLRLGFGLLWIFDGILQAQPAMAAGLPGHVIAPAAATSPGWVRDVVSWAGATWSFHPVQAGAAAVWIQAGLGIWMAAASRGPSSRLAGAAGAVWGLVVWVFGEAFGGILAPGLTVLFGAPGAAFFYCVAGGLLALPDRCWRSAALGRRLLRGLGAFLVAMAVLQAWPGRGFWQGTAHGRPGTLTGMVAGMAGTPQPPVLARLVSDFGAFTASHGSLVNGSAVAALAVIGIGLASRRKDLLGLAVIAAFLFCLADWVLVEDLGFFGGLGTDPNSMIPLLLLVSCGYVAGARPAPTAPAEPAAGPVIAPPAGRPGRGWRERLAPARLAGRLASVSVQGILAGWAVTLVLLGAAPMAAAQISRNADPIIARALGGASAPLDRPAPAFHLTDQEGRPVSLAGLRGKVVLLTFLDPACTADCPPLVRELRAADRLLGTRAAGVEIVAIAASRLHHARAYLQAFDRRERLTGLPNWLFLTGPLSQLSQAWAGYGFSVRALPAGQVTGHDGVVFVLDRSGRIRARAGSGPGAGTASSRSSFAGEFARAAEQAMSSGSPSS